MVVERLSKCNKKAGLAEELSAVSRMNKIKISTKLGWCIWLSVVSSSLLSLNASTISSNITQVTAPEHQKSIRNQKDFFDRFSPSKNLANNRTPSRQNRMNSHLDVSMFSDEIVETSGLPNILTPRRYNTKPDPKDFSRLLPSAIGPTGLIDSISANGLARGEFNAAYVHLKSENKTAGVFRNVSRYEATDVNLLFNYGLSDNFEVLFKFLHADRMMVSSLGTFFDSANVRFPEYGYGLKAHQNWRGKEFAIGFVNSTIDSRARNLILDPDFEYFKSIYLTMTNDLTYRTESHFTIKRNSTDKKYSISNSWISIVGGIDTKLTKDTHLMVELKYEDYDTPSRTVTMNGGLRHMMGSTGLEGFVRRINQPGFTEIGFKVSSAF